MTGKVIGTYQLLAELGQSLHGALYQAFEQARGQIVALRTVAPALALQTTFKQNLRTVAATLTTLRHPHLAGFHTLLQMGNEVYLAREFVAGEALTQTLQRAGVLPVEEAVRIATQALDALSHAHDAGLWHGGIKPNNLILAADGAVKLTDLGLAQAAEGELLQSELSSAVLNYAAPEQLHGGACDARTDVYAMGAVLYEMLTGLPPFRRNNTAALRHAQLEETPPSPRQYFPLIPQTLEQAVLRALNKTPEARFASAREFQTALLAWADTPAVTPAAAEITNQAAAVTAPSAPDEEPLTSTVPQTASLTTPLTVETPLVAQTWPQLAPVSSSSSSALHDERIVELETTAKRGFLKPVAAVTGVAALLGASYAFVRVSNNAPPKPGPGQVVIKVSPTLPPSPPVSVPTPMPAATVRAALAPAPRPRASTADTAKPKAAATKVPTGKSANIKAAIKPAAPAKAKAKVAALTTAPKKKLKDGKIKKEAATPDAAKKKGAAPAPAKHAQHGKQKGGGSGSFSKGAFGGKNKSDESGKKAAPTPTPKQKK